MPNPRDKSQRGSGQGVAGDLAGADRRQRLADGEACLMAALDYLRRGWPVLALFPPDHAGVGRKHGDQCDQPGKVP
jgi:hypothetical protein